MYTEILKSKIHRATITEANLDYEGSITIDSELMRLADIGPYEKVQVANITNGERLETYAIKGQAASGIICLNGAAAHKGKKGDLVIILSYALVEKDRAELYKPRIIIVDKDNKAV